jgi:cell division protein FtsZ
VDEDKDKNTYSYQEESHMGRPMQQHEPPQQGASIKVVGVGGGGCNAINRMIAEGVQGVDFIAINTDAQMLHASLAGERLQIGTRLTRGLGSGGKPIIGQSAAEEDKEELMTSLKGADMVFITAGMGGGTGTGAAPIVADLAQDLGILTVGVVTRPFGFEGNHRRRVAELGIEQLRPVVDTLIVVPNDRLVQNVSKHTSIIQAFRMADDVLFQGIQGIVDLITHSGLINVDFADVHAIMACAGTAWIAIGHGSGTARMVEAVNQALSSPLLEVSIEGARGVLCNIVGGEDLCIAEIHEGIDIVTRTVDPEANIIFGTVTDPTITNGEVKVTLIATGFDASSHEVFIDDRVSGIDWRVSGIGYRVSSDPKPDIPDIPDAKIEPPRPSQPLRPAALAASPDDLAYDDLDIPPFLRGRALHRPAQGGE